MGVVLSTAGHQWCYNKPKLLIIELKLWFSCTEREIRGLSHSWVSPVLSLFGFSPPRAACPYTNPSNSHLICPWTSDVIVAYLPATIIWHLWLAQIIKVNCSGFELLSAGSCWRGKLAPYLAFVQGSWEIKPRELQWEFSPPLPGDVCISLPNCLLMWEFTFLSQTSLLTSAVSLNKQNPNHKDCFKWQVCNKKWGKWMRAESSQGLMS